ncbi:hypothetical protein HYC85_021739 [Camellia sinensis]|uniref:Uncharacterized protein n=1 Tax=Camellia sinensis TaxID=4442 RepID=A0A7J7GIF9_CAMSI|nr:hypothetical protein HYC85_021739 [Camellia sinensis]
MIDIIAIINISATTDLSAFVVHNRLQHQRHDQHRNIMLGRNNVCGCLVVRTSDSCCLWVFVGVLDVCGCLVV